MEAEWGAYSVVDIPKYNPGVSASKEVARGFRGGNFDALRVARSDAFKKREAFFERFRGEVSPSRKRCDSKPGSAKKRCQWTSRAASHFISPVIAREKKNRPNKALEPTPTAVTPRANE
jgi:hypothetical protein